jgi:hypothetical protein
VRRAKLQSQAEIWALCSDEACAQVHVWLKDGTSFPSAAFFVTSIYDYRLGQLMPIVDIDVGILNSELNNESMADIGDSGYAVYIQTKSGGSYSPNSIRGVRLRNGSALPKKGLSFITNGRLWIQGNYNTQDYLYGERSLPAPAAIFSDSFGVLSHEWNDSYGANHKKSDRQVAQPVTIRTAVVTGFLRSQLEELYPDCTGTEINNYLQGCLDGHVLIDYGPGYDGWSSYSGNSWYSLGASCSKGLNSQGEPNEPPNCNIWVDAETGINYYRKIVLIRELYRRAYLKKHYPDIFNGIGNITGTVTPAMENEVPYEERLPNIDLNSDGEDDIDWRNLTGDQALWQCAQTDACWHTILNVERSGVKDGNAILWRTMRVDISKAEPPGVDNIPAENVYIGVLDPVRSTVIDYTPIADSPGYFEPTFSTEVLTIPRWEIPFNPTYLSHRNPPGGLSYGRGCAIVDDYPPEGVPILPGVYFQLLGTSQLYIKAATGYCSSGQTCWFEKKDPTCTENCGTIFRCTDCTAWNNMVLPGVAYHHGREQPLYKSRYSGGLENLINYQEDWREEVNFYFFGALAAPWFSKELIKLNGAPAFWNPDARPTVAYYSGPKRDYKYNKFLRENPPPASPDVYSVRRGRYKETVQLVQSET